MTTLQENVVAAGQPLAGAADRCPLCGGPNACQMCSVDAHKGRCWCITEQIPEELLARVPVEARHQACICRQCVTSFHRERESRKPAPVLLPQFYFDPGGLMVFTAAYLQQRGYCCGNQCRHCPY